MRKTLNPNLKGGFLDLSKFAKVEPLAVTRIADLADGAYVALRADGIVLFYMIRDVDYISINRLNNEAEDLEDRLSLKSLSPEEREETKFKIKKIEKEIQKLGKETYIASYGVDTHLDPRQFLSALQAAHQVGLSAWQVVASLGYPFFREEDIQPDQIRSGSFDWVMIRSLSNGTIELAS